jgi:hypothetical protein
MSPKRHSLSAVLFVSLALALSGCGGDGDGGTGSTDTAASSGSTSSGSIVAGANGDKVPAEATPETSPPGGLYFGYYQENHAANPEDPMPGAFYLKLPAKDEAYSGSMYFTYVGCQTSNVGSVSGVKSGLQISGSWSGTVDGTTQTGPYSGTYDPKTASYSGTYSNNGGKQFIHIPGCISYFIAPSGSWEMFPVEQNVPAGFAVSISGQTGSWPAVAGAVTTLAYVVDAAVVESGAGNPIVKQAVLPGGTTSIDLASLSLKSGKEYILVTMISDSAFKRLAFGSKRFTAP